MSSRSPIALAITLAKPGGATTFVFRFAQWLHRRGESVILLIGEEGSWLTEHCDEAGIPYERVPHLRRSIHPLHNLLAIRSFASLLRRIQPRALHLNSSMAGTLGSLAGRWVGIPKIVYCIAGWATLDASNPFQRALYLWPERLTARAKDDIVCLHDGDKQFAEEHGIRPKHALHVIPNGIDTKSLQASFLEPQEARRALGLPLDRPIIGCIANFYPAKDLARAMEAFAHVAKDSTEPHFCLIGDGPERAAIEGAIAQHGLSDRVHLAGRREQAAQYLRAFDVFTLPSKKEGMPYVLLEAAAAGLPIVATSVGANRWMLPEATIVPPRHPQALAEALVTALHTDQTPDYKTSLARFTEEACFDAHYQLLVG